MRIAVMSDIHGNDIAFSAVVADANARDVELFIIAGDLVSDYPQSSQVISRAMGLNAHVVMGNREDYFKKYFSAEDLHWHDYKQFSALLWSFKHMTNSDFEYIVSLPICKTVHINDFTSIYVTHFIQENEAVITEIDGNILISGHTHKPVIKWYGQKLYINPGSVGVNMSGGFAAEYVLLEIFDKHINAEKVIVPYDSEKLMDTINQSELQIDENAYHWFTMVQKTQQEGINYISEFFKLSEKLKAEHGYTCYDTPNDIWDMVVDSYIERGILYRVNSSDD